MMMMRRDATKHVCVACGQLIGIMVQTVSCGVLSNSHTDKCVHATPFGTPERKACYTARQFTGHLGPSCFILVFGVSALCHAGWPRARRCRFEGACALAASATYLGGDLTMQLWARRNLVEYYARPSLHTMMMAIVGLCGAAFRLAAQLPQQRGAAAARLGALPHLWFSASFALFIYQHKQPNAFGVVMHNAAILWISAAGALRLAGRACEGGACHICAAYAFFGGQTGFTFYAERHDTDVGAFALAWTFAGIAVRRERARARRPWRRSRRGVRSPLTALCAARVDPGMLGVRGGVFGTRRRR